MDSARLVADLDSLQRRAVTTTAAPLRILAGAGSGKTRVLTRRIAHRVATGEADPRHVLALTFTRKAAGEMRSRLRQLGLRDELAAGTFHAVAYAQLRNLWADRGQRPWELVDRKVPLVADLLPRGGRGGTTALDVVGEIEWAKARQISPEAYRAAVTESDRRPGVDPTTVVEVYTRYEEQKKRRRLLDFDDLLDGWRRAIERGDDFAQAQRWRFRHVFVDEFQDVNPLQHAVLKALLASSVDLCVVGDPRQAIYAWNGADAGYLVDFDRWWPGGATVELIDNYRSTPQILAVAAGVLAGGAISGRGAGRRKGDGVEDITGGASLQLRAHRPDGRPPSIVAFPDDATEAAGVARRVRDAHQPGGRWGRQAILVRTNGQSALMEQALRAVGVPCRVRAGGGFLNQPEVRAALREIGRTSGPFTTVVADLGTMADAARPSASDEPDLTGSESSDDATARDESRPPRRAVTAPVGSDDRAANIETLQRLARDYAALVPDPSVGGFTSWLRTSTGADEGGTSDAVEIATFHAAKGLEWPIVHLAGLEDGLVPIGHARTPAEIAEERRLFYVAVTRAEQELHCSWSLERTFGERTVNRRRSPFVDEAEAAGGLGATPARRGAARPGDATSQRPPRRRRRNEAGEQSALHDALREWRREQAKAARVPAYTVFNDETLDDLVAQRPSSPGELLDVRGMGPVKVSRFGDEILAIVAADDGE